MAQAADSSASSAEKQKAKGYQVQLYLYDLSGGLAQAYSQAFLGTSIDGIWHTSTVVYGVEYFYGGGIQSTNRPGTTPYGTPVRKIDMGETFLPQSVLHEYLREVSPRFSPAKYNLLKHNCNNFSDDLMHFLIGKNIPDFITGLPDAVMETEFGKMLRPMFEQMEINMKSQLGDWYIDTEPHLVPIDPKYDTLVTQSDDESPEAVIKAAHERAQNAAPKADQPPSPAKEAENQQQGPVRRTVRDDLLARDKDHKHHSLKLSIMDKEFEPKLTLDHKNAALYATLVTKKCADVTELQRHHLNQLLKYMDSPATVPLNEDALETLDELILITERDDLFGIVSLLRLLLVHDAILERYEDCTIVNQMIYKTGIQFTDEDDSGLPSGIHESDEKDSTDNQSVDLSLLQFSAIAAVSHLYSRGNLEVKNSFLRLAFAALKSTSVNVCLAASRLLFNVALRLRDRVLKAESSDEDGATAVIKTAFQQMNDIVTNIIERLQTDKHAPTRFRCLATLGVLFYCNDKLVSEQASAMKVALESCKTKDVAVTKDILQDVSLLIS